MGGGHVNQKPSYQSGVNFAPVVSGYGAVNSGHIVTGASGGNVGGQAQGSSVSLSVPMPMQLQNLGFSIGDTVGGSGNHFQNLGWWNTAMDSTQKGLEIGQLFVDPNSSAGKKLAGVQQGVDLGQQFGTLIGW